MPVAIVALITVQVVMVLIMTMTPLHMTAHGHDLAAVGLVISAHTFGMFALSPISGRLTDRFGSVPVILAGLAVTAVAAVLSAVAPPDGGVILFLALFLLGYGWNLGYVAGSALLTHGLGARRADAAPGPDRRAHLELGRGGQPRLRDRRRGRRLHDPRPARRGARRRPGAG